MKLCPIVEGHGEVTAAPTLLRRLLWEAGEYELQIGDAIRRTQAQFHREDDVGRAVRLALLDADCAAVLILFDEEDGCPAERGPEVLAWARAVAASTPVAVVVAYREYETWFLTAMESLRGRCGIRADAVTPRNPESKRDAKGALEEFMPANRAYSETSDQEKLSAVLDLAQAHRGSRSFRKLVKSVGELLRRLGRPLPQWPPPDWA